MRALITGITGQDGSYLAELLLSKGYEVHGIVQPSSTVVGTWRIDHIFDKLHLHYGSVTDSSRMAYLVRTIRPDEIYHLASQSHVRRSFDIPEQTADTTGLSTIRLLEAIRDTDTECKFYNAASSELFGNSPPPQNELTPFRPRSPYAVAKLMGYWATVNYREAYGIFAVNGILFNHESPRRGETFVTRKITRAIAQILKGERDELPLGYLDAKRDWGYSPDYVEAMWLMMQYKQPDDFVIATGRTYSVRQFLEAAFACVGLKPYEYYVPDKRLYRPTEVNCLWGSAVKAQKELGWTPTIHFHRLVLLMLQADLEAAGLEPSKYMVPA